MAGRPNIRVVPGKNVFVGTSNTFIHQHGPDGRVKSMKMDQHGNLHDITGIPHFKKVENQFNIVGGNLGDFHIAKAEKASINQTENTYEAGATHKKIDVQGGTFVGSNIGGNAEYNNQNSTMVASQGGKGGFSPIVWDYDVNSMLLKILKGGIEVDTLATALGRGLKLQDIATAVERTSADGIPALSDSLKTCNPQDIRV